MFYKTTLAISLASLFLVGCGNTSNDSKKETYDKSYYSKIDYSNIEKLSTMLLEKDPRFKDLQTQIPLAKLSVQVFDKNISFDTISRGMDEDGTLILYTEKENFIYQQFEDGNFTYISLLDNNGTEDETDDETLTVKYDKNHITTSGAGDMSITTYNSDNLKVVFPEAIMANGSVIVEYNTTSSYAIVRDGDLGVNAFNKMIDITENYPNIKEIRLKNIDGSVHDAINMQTGFLLRKAGLDTFVIDTQGEGTDIASGGVDLFCAGVNRSIENPQSVKLGIHSWRGAGDDGVEMQGRDFPKEHKRHHDQLLYFSEMLGVNDGYDFYFRTLEAASGEDIHTMTDQEIEKYKILTK